MILALKTVGMDTELYLVEADGGIIATDAWTSGRELADQLLGRILSLLAANGTDVAATIGIVVFSGPGSFTSLRIGHTVANAMAGTLGIAVVGASGGDWILSGVMALPVAQVGVLALPEYGAEANITKPKA